MNKLIVDVQTGEQSVVPMTAREIADAQTLGAEEAVKEQQRQAEQRKRNYLNQLAEKIEADPTILDRIK